MKKIILVDGNSIMFRAYYATAYQGTETLMKTSKGVYTNALFAFVNMFEKIVTSDIKYALVAFDTDTPTIRHTTYEGYKAGRSAMPEELAMQIPLIHEYLDVIGVKSYFKCGLEADDIIGTLAKTYKENGYEVSIFSSDKDLLQLVDEKVTVNLLKKGMKEVDVFTPSKIKEVYGLTCDQMIDLKALMGDPSDNIPGISGVGEKTAVKLLIEYNNLDEILKNASNIKGKLGEKIRDSKDDAILSKFLGTIITDAELDLENNDVNVLDIKTEELIEFFTKYEMNQKVSQISKKVIKKDFVYTIIDNEDDLAKILNKDLAIHIELSDKNYHKADSWGFGISDGVNSYYVSLEIAIKSRAFTAYLTSDYKKYTYDYKAFKVFLLWKKMTIKNVSFDLLLGVYVINSNLGKEEFKTISSYFDYQDLEFDDNIYGKGAKKALPDLSIYSSHIASKALAIYILKDVILEKLVENDQLKLFTDIEIPLTDVLASMEYDGLSVDLEEVSRQKEDLQTRIASIEKKIQQLAGKDFNVSSPKQLGEILFDDLKLDGKKKNKSRTGYVTDIDVLNSLKGSHEIIDLIIEYRQLSKLFSTYIEGLEQTLFDDLKVHTIYMQALTTTGRLSSIEPNLQNIPIRTNEGRQIRKIFIPKMGNYFLGADYSQIELRVLASIANVVELKKSFSNGEDIHTTTAKKVFNVDNVTSEQRRAAKAVNFGIIYGIGAWSLSEDIHVTPKEAQAFIDRYFEIYPEIKHYMEETVNFAKQHEYIVTIMNRRRYIPELKSPVYTQREFGKRTAFNAPIQGSAADIIKKAMIDLYEYLESNNKKSRLLLQVHDELILDVPEEELEEMKIMVPKIMANAYKMSVDLETSSDVGKNWLEIG